MPGERKLGGPRGLDGPIPQGDRKGRLYYTRLPRLGLFCIIYLQILDDLIEGGCYGVDGEVALTQVVLERFVVQGRDVEGDFLLIIRDTYIRSHNYPAGLLV